MNGMTDFEQLLYKELQEIRRELRNLRVDFAAHKVRSGFFGTIGGVLAVVGIKLASLAGWFK